MKPGEVGIVVVPSVFVFVMVVSYSVRVGVTVKAVVYNNVGIGETLVLPSWVVQDLAWLMGYLWWRSKIKVRKEDLCSSNMIGTRLRLPV